MVLAYAPFGNEPFADIAGYTHVDGLAMRRCYDRFELRIAGAPDQITGTNATEIDRPIGELKFYRPVTTAFGLVDTSTFFRLFRTAPVGRVEYESIARFERCEVVVIRWLDDYGIFVYAKHCSHQ